MNEAALSVLPAPAQALLGTDAVAHVWTQSRSGGPQVSVVWVIVEEDQILFGADANSVKIRNLTHNDRVVLSIEDEERNHRGFQRHLVIHGHAEIRPGPDPELMDRLARKYLGLDRHPLALRDSPTAVTVAVTIDRLTGEGPWVD